MRRITIEVWNSYYAVGDEWRWRARGPNGKIMASGKGYMRKQTMLRTIRRLWPDAEAFPIKEVVA